MFSSAFVSVSPVLQSQSLASIDTIVGSSVTIHCAFSGFPAPSITWQKVGGNISSAVNISYITTTMNGSYPVVNSSMKFDKIQVSDHGAYECIAKNPAGSPSTKFSINVTCKHPYYYLIQFFQQFIITLSDILISILILPFIHLLQTFSLHRLSHIMPYLYLF